LSIPQTGDQLLGSSGRGTPGLVGDTKDLLHAGPPDRNGVIGKDSTEMGDEIPVESWGECAIIK
jgi:hypothetical protein